MPTARYFLAAATGYDGRIYALGGFDGSGLPLATVELLSLFGGSASLLVRFPGAVREQPVEGTVPNERGIQPPLLESNNIRPAKDYSSADRITFRHSVDSIFSDSLNLSGFAALMNFAPAF